MADIFISYASEDREWVRKLASTLEVNGWSVWWDRNIIAGQSFDEVIERELEVSKSVIVVWSKNSIYSEWVKNEASVASELGRLVPILIDHVKVPLEFRRKQTADLVDWNGSSSHEGLQMMQDGVVAITKKIGKKISLQDSTPPITKYFPEKRRLYLAIGALIAAFLGLITYTLNISLFSSKIPDIDTNIQESSTAVKAMSVESNIMDEPKNNLNLDSKWKALNLSEKTVFPGVVAYVSRFENTGGLVTLELTFKNMISKNVEICANEFLGYYGTKIIDELSGSSWSIKYHGGDIDCSDKIYLIKGGTHIVWMKFYIKNPESRKFTLDWNILKKPLENLVIKKRS